ncbi:MAG: hypothetical protein H7202_11615 [Pedobacter sp.]|nr:hypothetical protein [Pedobacter sp.]
MANGAVGVIMCTATNTSRGLINTRSSVSMLNQKGKIVSSSTFPFAKTKIVGTVSNFVFATIFTQAGKVLTAVVALLKKGVSQSFTTNFRLNSTYETTYVDFNTFNIAGKIEGTDSKLKMEYLVHSAHLDLLGVGTVVKAT